MSIRRRLTALERRVERLTHEVVITMVDEDGQRLRLADDGTWVPLEPGDLDDALVITLDWEGREP